jgi:PAS domain S-box-containing protein
VRLNIGPRLTLCFVLLILSMVGSDAVVLWQFHMVRVQSERMNGLDQKLVAVLRVHTSLLTFHDRMEALTDSEDAGRLLAEAAPLHAAVLEETQRAREALRVLPPALQRDPTILPTLEIIQDALQSQLEAITSLARMGDWRAVRLRLANQIHPLEALTSTLVEKVDHEVGEEQAETVLHVRQVERRVFIVVPATVALTLLLAAALSLTVTRSITQALAGLVEGSKRLARGDFQHVVRVSGEDELAHLGHVFNDTARQLRELYATLQSSEDQLRRVINTIPAHVTSMLPDGSVEFVNDRLLEYTGYSISDLLGWNWNVMLHPEDVARARDAWQRSLAMGEPLEMELRIRRADGAYRWFLTRRVPLRDAAGKIVRWYGTSFEIEDRKQAEELLRRNELYLAEAQRLSHTGSFGWNVSTGEIVWSEQTNQIFGNETGSKPTLPWILERTHPEDRALVQSVLDQACDEGKNFDLEHRVRMPDGTVKHLHVVGHELTDASDNLEFVGAITDITPTKQAEEALRKSEEQWRDVFENNPTMYFMVNAAGAIVAINPFGAQQLGYTIAELVGRPVLQVFWEADREAVERNVALCFAELGRGRSWEARKVRSDGTVMWVRETAKAVSREDGPIVLIACEDTTEQKNTEEALRQAQMDLAHVNRVNTMGELTASLAHELNQPMTAAVTNASACVQWLRREPPQVEEAREAAARIVKDGQRAGEIISRIRLLFKRATPERELVDVNEVIQEMLVLLRGQAKQYSISIRTELMEQLPWVLGDRVQLQQVMMNLIVNSIDALKDVEGERTLVIESQETETQQVLVSVRDTGVGLPPRQADQIFNAFFTTKPHGIGMGLRISCSIVESHGGRLWAAENTPRGASFHLTLPSQARAD